VETAPASLEQEERNSVRVASRIARVARITRSVASSVRAPTVRCTLPFLEQRYPRFEGSDLLGLYIIIYALLPQPIRVGVPSNGPLFGLSGFEWSDDKVVELGHDVNRKKFDPDLDLLGTLGTKGGCIGDRREDLENK